MKKLLKKIIITVMLMPFILIFLYFTLNYLGFCFKKCKFLSDEEKIDGAIKSVLGKMYVRAKDGNYYPDPEINVPYLKPKKNAAYIIFDEDVSNFKLDNPNCCSLSKFYYKKNGEVYKISSSARKLGMTSDFVTVKFKYKDINGEEKEDSVLVPISNCGRHELSINESL
jgi:hypothetical protein